MYIKIIIHRKAFDERLIKIVLYLLQIDLKNKMVHLRLSTWKKMEVCHILAPR